MKIDKEKIKRRIEANNKTFFDTPFEFLESHNSFRPGSFHTFLGKSGQGKSTLMRSLIFSLLAEKKVFVWLSEETTENMLVNLLVRYVPDEWIDNLEVYSEIESSSTCQLDLYLEATNRICEFGPDIILFDNITTSMAYGDVIENQSAFISKIKALIGIMQVPMIVFAHTKSGIPDNKMIDDDDIRGFKKISNMSDYFYVIQMFYIGENKFQSVRIIKSRYHDNAVNRFYRLNYDSSVKSYISDKEHSFLEFKEIWNKRNKL